MNRVKVKICCILNIEEAEVAIGLGADAIGLAGPIPSGPGIISNEQIRHIVDNLPENVDSFLLTSETRAEDIVAHHKLVGTKTIQLVDKLESACYQQIRDSIPGINIVQLIHINDHQSVEYALSLIDHVDALLLDSGNPNLKLKQLGGTGKVHDWDLSKQIVNKSTIPVYLAGGLSPTNVTDAIRAVSPYGVDLCSGVRTEGRLDNEKLIQFFDVVNNVE